MGVFWGECKGVFECFFGGACLGVFWGVFLGVFGFVCVCDFNIVR